MSDNTLLLARGAMFGSAWLLGGGLFVLLYAASGGGIEMTPWRFFVSAYLTAISVLLLTRPE